MHLAVRWTDLPPASCQCPRGNASVRLERRAQSLNRRRSAVPPPLLSLQDPLDLLTAAAMSDVHKFDAVFNRVAGTLTLTSTTLAWVPTAGQMDRQQQALNRVIRESACASAGRLGGD